MHAISLTNFRCFQSTDKIELRPLTILVGENSAGKSSFLAAIRLAWDLCHSSLSGRLNFNEEPFQLGAYSQIAHFRGGKAGRAKRFTIGGYTTSHTDPPQTHHEVFQSATFKDSASQPMLVQQELESGPLKATVIFDGAEEGRAQVELRTGSKRTIRTIRTGPFLSDSSMPIDWHLLTLILRREAGDTPVHGGQHDSLISLLTRLSFSSRVQAARPLAMSPTRTNPLRTYNPLGEDYMPEGGHIPMVLAKARRNKALWDPMRKHLNAFGRRSAMFGQIKIKHFGGESDPFQIQVKGVGPGPAANLIDVGYGVSQVLPILVECLSPGQGKSFLFQQPEVHLHPKAQAELGTFFAQSVSGASPGNQYIIETHSDYLIDRLRIECKAGRLDPGKLAIHYFDKPNIDSRIRTMHVDDCGNINGAPDGYRAFFLEEQRRVLRGD